MGKGLDLLKLLEPTVRPGNLPGPLRPAPAGPIESRSFESLLEEAQTPSSVDSDATGGAGAAPQACAPAANRAVSTTSSALTALAQVDRIENETLRQLVGGPRKDR